MEHLLNWPPCRVSLSSEPDAAAARSSDQKPGMLLHSGLSEEVQQCMPVTLSAEGFSSQDEQFLQIRWDGDVISYDLRLSIIQAEMSERRAVMCDEMVTYLT